MQLLKDIHPLTNERLNSKANKYTLSQFSTLRSFVAVWYDQSLMMANASKL